MVKFPRDLSGAAFVRRLKILGYEVERQTGSHIICSTLRNGRHSVSVPNHNPIRKGTLLQLIRLVAAHHNMRKEDLAALLFDD